MSQLKILNSSGGCLLQQDKARITPYSIQDCAVSLSHCGLDMRGTCPICFDRPKQVIETNCGHTYCSKCILAYWHLDGDWEEGNIKCPICRQIVVKIHQRNLTNTGHDNHDEYHSRSFIAPEVDDRSIEHEIEARQSNHQEQTALRCHNRQHRHHRRSFHKRDINCNSDRRNSRSSYGTATRNRQLPASSNLCYRAKLYLLATIMYLMSPIDLIPEIIFGVIGLIDDFIVVLVCIASMMLIFLEPFVYHVWRKLSFFYS